MRIYRLDAVKRIKQEHPNYGRTRLRRLFEKETGFSVSDSTVTRALRRMGLQLPPKKEQPGCDTGGPGGNRVVEWDA